MAPRRVSFDLVSYKLSENVTSAYFEEGEQGLGFLVGIPSQNLQTTCINHLKNANHGFHVNQSGVRKLTLDKLSAPPPPPRWFFEHKKAWFG